MNRLVLMCLLVLCCHSCIVPVPHRRVHQAGWRGQVMDERTRLPVEGAKIVSGAENGSTITTDQDGCYRIDPIYGWHGAYLFGPISYSMFPHFDMPYPLPPFWVHAPGYRRKKVDKEGVVYLESAP